MHPGLDSTVVMLGHKLQGVQVVREYDRSLPKIPAYAAELNQVWTNLIDNAADAMGGCRHAGPAHRAADGEHLLVEVADDGPGMPPEVAAPGVRGASSRPRARAQGSGLGLENAQRIVERRHRGRLGFTTGPDGTCFEVRLPLTQARE